MSDEWSLKGKTKGMQMPLYIGGVISNRFESVYFETDIETLRQKLIENFDKCAEEGQYEDIMDHKKIINKIFGVK